VAAEQMGVAIFARPGGVVPRTVHPRGS
jgi:hypothetical protein